MASTLKENERLNDIPSVEPYVKSQLFDPQVSTVWQFPLDILIDPVVPGATVFTFRLNCTPPESGFKIPMPVTGGFSFIREFTGAPTTASTSDATGISSRMAANFTLFLMFLMFGFGQ
eukprot:m.1271527 g.1271527  ORF g.1271527 m.1271527 type:complete len:118 (+) comp24750_c0_seq36:3985-4338(+)